MLNQQYKEIVRAKRALLSYFIACLSLTLLTVLAILASPHHNVQIDIEGVKTINIPMLVLLLIPAFPAGIFATVLGTGLSCENQATLAWAWTRPISRTNYAIGMFVVDLAAIIASFIIAFVVLELLPLAIFGFTKYITFGPLDGGALTRGLIFPVAVYLFCQALTALLKRNGGMVAALAWPVGFVLSGLQQAPLLAQPFAMIIAVLNLVNPWAYISFQVHGNEYAVPTPELVQTLVTHTAGLAALAAFCAVVAVLEWNRLEA